MKDHIMLVDYNGLKKGERIIYLGNTRDSGYLVNRVHNGDNRVVLPFDRDVCTVKRAEECLKRAKKNVVFYTELLDYGKENPELVEHYNNYVDNCCSEYEDEPLSFELWKSEYGEDLVIIQEQMEFVQWLKDKGMYDQFESSTSMQKMHDIWIACNKGV